MNTRMAFRFSLVTVLSTAAWAGGFGLREQGHQGMSASGAVVARAEEGSAMFYNPAGLTQLKYNELILSARGLSNKSFYSNAGQSTWNADTESNVAPTIFWTVTKPKYAFGFGTTATHDWQINWSEPDFPARFLASEASFQAQEFFGAFAVKLSNSFSAGVSFRHAQADTSYTRVLARPFTQDNPGLFYETAQRVEADGDGTAFTFGLQYYRGRRFSMGFSYQSALDLDMDGSNQYRQITRTNDQRAVNAFNNDFTSGSVTTSVELPETWQIGMATRVTVRTRVEVDLEYEAWSSVENDTYQITPNGGVPGQLAVPRNWDDIFSLRIAGDFQQRKALLWQMGLAFTENPIPDSTVEASFPDFDRFQYSFGLAYSRTPKYILQAALLYVQTRDRRVAGQEFFFDPNAPNFVSPTGGEGLYETQRWQLNLGLKIRFGAKED